MQKLGLRTAAEEREWSNISIFARGQVSLSKVVTGERVGFVCLL